MAYPELVSGLSLSKTRKCKWLMKVGASIVSTPWFKLKYWPGEGGFPGNQKNPGYATGLGHVLVRNGARPLAFGWG